jgi:hypothetical protein
MPESDHGPRPLPADLQLPATLLARYLFFLSRRPISRSNTHYIARRLAGLQSLAPLLRRDGEPPLVELASELERLGPASFNHRAGRLQALLAGGLQREPAAGVVVSAAPPGDDFFAPVRRVTLIFGPAIGIGDEILCFAAARRLRARLPRAEISVLTAYDGLWDLVPEIDRAIRYERHAELVAAIRGTGPAGRAELVALFDFEKPDLVAAVGFEPGVERFVEVSLGVGSAAAFDAGGGWLHRFAPAAPLPRNYYARLDLLLEWLCGEAASAGAAPAGGRFPARARAAPPQVLDVLVSPFTSKHEPSLVYWSRLLGGLVPEISPALPARLRLRLDPGPNLSTERFAAALAAAVRPTAPFTMEVEIARGNGRRTASLAEMLRAMAEADVVVTTDSFAAHAAPLAGCLTLVVAQPGLADWRVPSPRSFYFEDSLPLPSIAAAMRQLIAASAAGAGGNGHDTPRPWSPPGGRRLLDAGRRLDAALAAAEGTAAPVCRAYEDLAQALRGFAAAFGHWPRESAALLLDRPYTSLLPALPPDAALRRDGAADLRRHARARLDEWVNSNLHKYLALIEQAPDQEAR